MSGYWVTGESHQCSLTSTFLCRLTLESPLRGLFALTALSGQLLLLLSQLKVLDSL
jgi:hypothetical protein